MLSHATSYSSFYVIDEKEEARLKQIAFEKYMAEKAIEEKMARREEELQRKQEEMRTRPAKKKRSKKPTPAANRSVKTSNREAEMLSQQQELSLVEVADQSAQYSKQVETSKEEKESCECGPSDAQDMSNGDFI